MIHHAKNHIVGSVDFLIDHVIPRRSKVKGMANDGKHMGNACRVGDDYIVAGCIGDSCNVEVGRGNRDR